MTIVIVILLILMAFVQGIMIARKKVDIGRQEDTSRVNELMGYINDDSVNATDSEGRSVLMIASALHCYDKSGAPSFYDVVVHAIKNGVDLNYQTKEGKTALTFALENELNEPTVKYLLDANLDVNLKDVRGRIALFDAIKSTNNNYDLVVSKTSNLDDKSKNENTALMVAAKNMNIYPINDLLERGADPKCTNIEGANVYEIAKQYASSHYIITRTSNVEGGTHHDSTASEIKAAKKHNHEIDETVRKLKCAVKDKPYKYKK